MSENNNWKPKRHDKVRVARVFMKIPNRRWVQEMTDILNENRVHEVESIDVLTGGVYLKGFPWIWDIESLQPMVFDICDDITKHYRYKGQEFDSFDAAFDHRIRLKLAEFINKVPVGGSFSHYMVDNKKEVIKILNGEF